MISNPSIEIIWYSSQNQPHKSQRASFEGYNTPLNFEWNISSFLWTIHFRGLTFDRQKFFKFTMMLSSWQVAYKIALTTLLAHSYRMSIYLSTQLFYLESNMAMVHIMYFYWMSTYSCCSSFSYNIGKWCSVVSTI